MQSKIAHAAERKAFEIALDQALKTVSGSRSREKRHEGSSIWRASSSRTHPGATRGRKAALYPGIKVGRSTFFSLIDEINPNVLRTTILNGGYEAAFRGLRNTTENADKNQCNVPWIILFDPTSACNKHCVGCWAAEYGNRLNLTYDEMDRARLRGGRPWGRTSSCLLAVSRSSARPMSSSCRGTAMTSVFNIFTMPASLTNRSARRSSVLGNVIFSVSLESYEPTVMMVVAVTARSRKS